MKRILSYLCDVWCAFMLGMIVCGFIAGCRLKSPGDGDVIIQPPIIQPDKPIDPSFEAEAEAIPVEAWAFAGPVEELAAAKALASVAPPEEDDGGVLTGLYIVFYDDESGLETDRQRVVELTTANGIRWPVGQLWPSDSFKTDQRQRVGAKGIGLVLGAQQ